MDEWFIISVHSQGAIHLKHEIVQHILQKRFDLSRWKNEHSGTPSGTMWFQIVVSLKFHRPLYMMGARLSWPVKKLRGANINVNIFVNIRPILNIVVSLDCN